MSTVATRTDVHNTFGSLLHVHVSKELAMLWRTLLILLTLSEGTMDKDCPRVQIGKSNWNITMEETTSRIDQNLYKHIDKENKDP